MNWRRISELAFYDLRFSVFSRKGLLFLFPFFVFWYLVLKKFYDGVAALIQSSEALMIASTKFDIDILTNLFIDHPPSLSSFFILAVYSTPLFAMLIANDMYATDLGSGYFRYLISRTQRIEIFLARYLSTFILIACSLVIVGIASSVISVQLEGYAVDNVLIYFIQIIMILFLYICPYIAFMAIISALMNSAIAALCVSMVSYISILIFIFIANATFEDTNLFFYLLPSGMKIDLIVIDYIATPLALASLPAYTFAYGYIAWTIFTRRNF